MRHQGENENQGITPIFHAIKNNDLETVKLLHERDAKLDIECLVMENQSLQPILYACKLGHTSIVGYIIEQLKDTLDRKAVVSNTGSDCVHLAAHSSDLDLLSLLIENKFELFNQNKKGDLALHIALRFNNNDLTSILLEQTTLMSAYSLNVENKTEKLTPYMLALMKGNYIVAEELEKRKLCSRSYKNADDESIFDIAERLDIQRLKTYLGP